MNWASFEVGLKLEPVIVQESAPLSAHKDWLNGGGAVKRAEYVGKGSEEEVYLIVHSTKRAIVVKWHQYTHYAWGKVHTTPYETLRELGWDNPHSKYVRIPTPAIAHEPIPD